MRKMHLSARVPNEGAARLARWIAKRAQGRLDRAASQLRLDEVVLDRVILGEIIPGDLLSRQLAAGTGIDKRLFQQAAQSTWFNMPARQPARRVARRAA